MRILASGRKIGNGLPEIPQMPIVRTIWFSAPKSLFCFNKTFEFFDWHINAIFLTGSAGSKLNACPLGRIFTKHISFFDTRQSQTCRKTGMESNGSL
jgi:hypothetical protein